MPAQSPAGGAQAGYFILADISGYTGFVANNDLAHAQGILAEITDLLIAKLSAPFRFVELEGDAVFVFAPDAAVEDAERLVDIMEACYAAFRIRLEQMAANTSCDCTACRAISDLDLKCVAHFGPYLPQSTPTGTKLVGPDVILAHRLLKNSVIAQTGIKAYALLTDAFIARARFGERGLGLPRHVEQYPELGTVHGRVVDLAASIERWRAAARRYLATEDADMEIVIELPAPRSVVWAYCIDAKRRLRWQHDARSVENHASASGRAGVGWESHCDHGGYRLDHRIVDWQPFDYITMETVSSGRSLKKPPPSTETFALEELPADRCKLSFRVRLKNRNSPVRRLFALIRPLVRREWERHFEVLARVVREDVARAEAGP
jgi:uncharacterized protein YndB with AHSA1/START domain